MARFILHIGTHKTATTHIQDTFHRNRALLKAHGVTFPYVGRTNGQHALVHAWIPMPAPYSVRNPARIWDKLIRSYADTDSTLMVSSEEFSRLRPHAVNMTQLREMLAGFAEVRVICTLRNQASFLQSVYQQISDRRRPAPWLQFFNAACADLQVDGLSLDYNRLYGHVTSGFAPEEVRLLSYENAVAGEGGIVGAMLREIGVDLTADQLAPFADRNSNVSPPPIATLVANMLAGTTVAPGWMVRLVTEKLAETLGPDARTTIFTRPELVRMRDIFGQSNRLLAARVAAHQPGFQVAPMAGLADRLVYRSQLPEAFWQSLCRAVYTAKEF